MQDFLHLCILQMGSAPGQVQARWSAGPESGLLQALPEESSSNFLYITGELVNCLGYLICRVGITPPSGGAEGIACLGRRSLVLEMTKPSRPVLSFVTRDPARKVIFSWPPSSEVSLQLLPRRGPLHGRASVSVSGRAWRRLLVEHPACSSFPLAQLPSLSAERVSVSVQAEQRPRGLWCCTPASQGA